MRPTAQTPTRPNADTFFWDGQASAIDASLCGQRISAMDRRRFFSAYLKIGFLEQAGLCVCVCEQKQVTQTPPPPTVTVAKPIKKEIVEWLYFTAQTQAVDTVTITPRVTGYIDNITFKEGDIVHFGDLLFVIDPRPYQAALDQAKGQLQQALAQQKLDNANLERAQDLYTRNVIAKQDFDTRAEQNYDEDATVVADQASVEAAQLNMDFTQVRSPIHGRIGVQLVNRGNL